MMADFNSRNDSNESSPLNAEKVAALIDGRLSEDERAALLARLGESDEDLSVMIDAASAVAHLDEPRRESAPIASIASARKRRWRGVTFATVSLAAAAVAVVVLRTPSGNVESASEMVNALSSHDALPPDWNYAPWRVQRGGEGVGDSSVFIRIGVRATDLELAIRARDTTVARFANDISMLLGNVPGGSAVGAIYQRLAANPQSNELLTNSRSALAGLPRQDLITIGGWLEAARIAAARQDREWFGRESNQQMIQRLVDLKQISPADGKSAREMVRDTVDWSSVEQIFERILHDQ